MNISRNIKKIEIFNISIVYERIFSRFTALPRFHSANEVRVL